MGGGGKGALEGGRREAADDRSAVLGAPGLRYRYSLGIVSLSRWCCRCGEDAEGYGTRCFALSYDTAHEEETGGDRDRWRN